MKAARLALALAAAGTVVLGSEAECACRSLVAEDMNWIGFDPPAEPFRAEVQVRYRHEPAPALVALDGRLAEIRFDRPFLFVLRERLTGTILFMGVIHDPTA